MQISTVTQILKRHTLTQERAHSQTSHRPLLGPFLETWSVRLQLIPKVRGGCENVSTVYPGAFWRLYCSCSHCDLDTVTSCERVYCVSTARRGLAPRCEISSLAEQFVSWTPLREQSENGFCSFILRPVLCYEPLTSLFLFQQWLISLTLFEINVTSKKQNSHEDKKDPIMYFS